MNCYSYLLIENDDIIFNYKNVTIKNKMKNSIKNGIIQNKINFLKEFKIILKENKLSSFLIIKNIYVIVPYNASKNDIVVIDRLLQEIGYREIKICKMSSLIRFTKEDNYLYFNHFFFLDKYNNKSCLILDELLTEKEKKDIIKKRSKNKNLYIINSNISFENEQLNYYYLPNNYLLKMLKNKLKKIY